MADQVSRGIFRRLIGAWNNVSAALPKLNSSADMRPTDIHAVLRSLESRDRESVPFELKPVVFRVPHLVRRASGELYVVVRGLVSFDRERFNQREELATRSFSTEVAYFVREHTKLAHVFGAHYDFAIGDVAHPVFHGQLKSFASFADQIRADFNLQSDVEDRIEKILEAVRIPTAQMDVFSVFLQICADHLMHAGSAAEERRAFDTLIADSGFCMGAAWQVERLGTDQARLCYRSKHWYPTGI
jgi:hypothetical protein